MNGNTSSLIVREMFFDGSPSDSMKNFGQNRKPACKGMNLKTSKIVNRYLEAHGNLTDINWNTKTLPRTWRLAMKSIFHDLLTNANFFEMTRNLVLVKKYHLFCMKKLDKHSLYSIKQFKFILQKILIKLQNFYFFRKKSTCLNSKKIRNLLDAFFNFICLP